jgi:hypothetical protein
MKPERALLGLAALLLGNAAAPIPPLTPAELAFARTEGAYHSYRQQPLAAWEEDLAQALAGAGPDQTADRLAPRYGLTSADMRNLVRLWLTVRARHYGLERDPDQAAALRRQLLALLPATRRAPLALQVVAESLDAMADCSGEDFAAMMAGSADPAADGWAIANAAECGDNFLRAAAAAPDRAMPALIRLAHYGTLEARDALPLYHWLTRPAALARIAEADRPALAAWLYGRYARLLFETGLTERAVALIDGLPGEVRRRVMAPPAAGFTALVDGLPVTIEEPRAGELAHLELAAAYAVAGRSAEAEAMFAAMPRVAGARHAFDCSWRFAGNGPEPGCRDLPYEESISQTIDLLVLDHFLHHPQDDPYPLAEAGFSGPSFSAPGAAVAELRCRVFAEPRFANICGGARSGWHYRLRPGSGAESEEAARRRDALAALAIPGLAEARAEIAAALAPLIAAAGTAATERPDFTRPAITPAPTPFAELALPQAYRGPRPRAADWPRGVAALPEGFVPVRFERSGGRAVAISLSQTYDPTGEVSRGGYWIHLSQDGGRHWQRPLYTGLADRFPYVVAPASRLPLLNGERLDLEVEVAELDTTTISYPPVALRSRRQATNLYLQLPLAELARDSDGDGVTDLAARTLLLDRARTDGGTPFIVGSDAGAHCSAPSAERLALVGLIERLFSVRAGAIVEPLDRPPGDIAGMMAGWRGAAAAVDRPVFIAGDPRDYACLRPNRLMIVYGEADIAELRRFRPDFHAVTMPTIVYNRARDRGYAAWSLGWTGGTYRLRLVNGRWVLDQISSWIT